MGTAPELLTNHPNSLCMAVLLKTWKSSGKNEGREPGEKKERGMRGVGDSASTPTT